MARGNPDNVKYLKPWKKGEISREVAARNGSKGGKRSVEVRRQKKQMCELLREYLNMNSEIDPSKTVGEEYIAALVAQMLMNPSAKDLEVITRVLGELVNKTQVDADVKVDVKPELFKLPVDKK